MAKSVILLCLTAVLCGAVAVAHARVHRQEITRGQPGFNTATRGAAASATAHLYGLVPDHQNRGVAGAAGGAGAGRGIGGGSSSRLHLSPHHFRGSRRGGGGRGGPEGHSESGGMVWHRRRFGDRHAMEREMMRNRGRDHRATGSSRASGMHRMAQPSSMVKGGEPRLPQHQRTMEQLRAELSHYNQMARRGQGQGVRGQGRHGIPDLGRFDANGPHHGSAMDGRLGMMSQRFGGRGPHLSWMPQSGRHPALGLGGQGFPRGRGGRRGGHHGMHMMGHGGDDGVMGGYPHPRRGGHGMGLRFGAP